MSCPTLESPLVRAPRASALRGVPALDGERATDSEGQWWDAKAWHPDRARPIHPASPTAGFATDIRPDLLGTQLAGAVRPRRCRASATLHPGRPSHRGGRGLGAILRPREPRRADRKVGKPYR